MAENKVTGEKIDSLFERQDTSPRIVIKSDPTIALRATVNLPPKISPEKAQSIIMSELANTRVDFTFDSQAQALLNNAVADYRPRRLVDEVEKLEAQGVAQLFTIAYTDTSLQKDNKYQPWNQFEDSYEIIENTNFQRTNKTNDFFEYRNDTKRVGDNFNTPIREWGPEDINENRKSLDNDGASPKAYNVAAITPDSLTDAVLGNSDSQSAQIGKSLLKNDSSLGNGILRKKIDLTKMFQTDDKKLTSKINPDLLNKPVGSGYNDDLGKNSFPNGLIPVSFPEENISSYYETGLNEESPIDDDVAYVPLSFTDLRPHGNTLRTIYFRPFITSFTEDFLPEWNKQSFYGRVDPVSTWQSTTRTITLSFEIHAFYPEDIPVIYKKLNWLASMTYPEYDKDLILKSGPVVRMRIGDVIKSGNRKGLSGVIDSLSYDYSDSLWELKKDYKVPKTIRVALQFTVIHDVVIGLGLGGQFGGIGKFDPSTGLYKRPDQLLENVEANDGSRVIDTSAFRGIGEVNEASWAKDKGSKSFNNDSE